MPEVEFEDSLQVVDDVVLKAAERREVESGLELENKVGSQAEGGIFVVGRGREGTDEDEEESRLGNPIEIEMEVEVGQ